MASLALALLAGVLSTLSPCVLPLVPIVLGSAASERRYGPMALASGLAISFTVIGLFVATLGFAVGIDGTVFRILGAVILSVLGVVLMVPALQQQFAVAAGPAVNWVQEQFGGFSTSGVRGQFALGLLLGAVWSPCAGPTLGAASVLASQGQQILDVALTMSFFGVGAALPLVLIGMLSRERLAKLRGRLMSAGSNLRTAMGAVLLAVGIAVITGLDKRIEAWLVERSPEWLTWLTTSV